MEIKEVVSYFFNTDSNIMEVSFRTIEDNDDVLRTDNIDYQYVEDYGFDLVTVSFDFMNEEFEDDDFIEEDKVELDEDELVIFLNEYYTINPHSLPKAELY